VGDNTNFGMIQSFLIQKNNIMVVEANDVMPLDIVQKSKQPLFVTKDGKGIFLGDSYFSVNVDTLNANWVVKERIADDSHLKLSPIGSFQFSTREKAEEYVLLYKPCLSVQEVANVYSFGMTLDCLLDKVENIAKQKSSAK
jgi:hypothetical protein